MNKVVKIVLAIALLSALMFVVSCNKEEPSTTVPTTQPPTTLPSTTGTTVFVTTTLAPVGDYDPDWPAFELGCQTYHGDFDSDIDAINFAFGSKTLVEVAPSWMPPDKRAYYTWWEQYWHSAIVAGTEWTVTVGAIGGNAFSIYK